MNDKIWTSSAHVLEYQIRLGRQFCAKVYRNKKYFTIASGFAIAEAEFVIATDYQNLSRNGEVWYAYWNDFG